MSTALVFASPSVLLLGVGRLGSEVASRLLDGAEGKLVGIVARDRGAFDARGLSRATARELMRRGCNDVANVEAPRNIVASRRGATMLPPWRSQKARLDFTAPDVFLGMLAKLEWPLLVDCTGATGVERVYAEAGRRGIRVMSAAWLAPRDSLRSAARAMLRVSVDRPGHRAAGAA